MSTTQEFKRSFLTKILRNTFAAVGVRILMIIVSILLIPFMIAKLGKQEFGVLALLGAATGYIGLFDVGFNAAFIKYISKYFTKGDTTEINKIINSGLGFYILWAGLVVALSYFFLQLFLFFFSISPSLIEVTIFSFWLTIAALCLNNIFLIFGTALSGIQRIDISSIWTGVMVILRSMGIVILLLLGLRIRGVVIINLLVVFLTGCINIVLCKRLLPGMSINLKKYFNWRTLRKLFNFGYKLQVSNISTIIFNNIDKILIGRFCGLEWVTFYQVGARILEKVKAIPQMFFAALLPGFSEIDALREKKLILQTYRKSAKLLGLIFLPVLLVIISASHSIILLWLGRGFENAVYVIRVLGFGYCFFLFLGLGLTLATSIGKTDLVMRVSIFQSISNIFLSILFVNWFGFKGIVFGTFIALFGSFIFLTISLSHQLEVKLKDFFSKDTCVVLLINVFAFLCSLFVGFMLTKFFVSGTRIYGLITVSAQIFCFAVIFIISQSIVKPLNHGELTALQERIPYLSKMLRMFVRKI